MTKVTLTVERHEGDKTIFESEQFEIRKIKLIQFTKTLNHVKDIIKALNEDESISELFAQFFEDGSVDAEGMDAQEVEKLIQKADNEFLIKGVQAFNQLVTKLPDHAISLLSTISGIDPEKLYDQELETVLDIFDAVVEVNDVEALITRLKKSFGQTTSKLKFLQFRKEVTA
jgi:hypothetical protein